jgi:predicted DNA binding protein
MDSEDKLNAILFQMTQLMKLFRYKDYQIKSLEKYFETHTRTLAYLSILLNTPVVSPDGKRYRYIYDVDGVEIQACYKIFNINDIWLFVSEGRVMSKYITESQLKILRHVYEVDEFESN